MLIKTERKLILKAYKAMFWIYEQFEVLTQDPMTAACGAPIDDITRHIEMAHAQNLHNHLDKIKGIHGAHQLANILADQIEECYLAHI